MTDLQFYSLVMFWAGVFLTRIIFFFENKWKEESFYSGMSTGLFKFLLIVGAIEVSKEKRNPDKYLNPGPEERANKKMVALTEVLLSCFDEKQRSKIYFRSWGEVNLMMNFIKKEKKEEPKHD